VRGHQLLELVARRVLAQVVRDHSHVHSLRHEISPEPIEAGPPST
jgi:hypothetical protein